MSIIRTALFALPVLTFTMLAMGCAASPDEDEDFSATDDEEATESSESALFGSSKAAPTCVKLITDDKSVLKQTRDIVIRNDCKVTVKVGLDLAYQSDTKCVTLKPKNSTEWHWSGPNASGISLRKIKQC